MNGGSAIILLLACLAAACREAPQASVAMARPANASAGGRKLVVPDGHAYAGAYIDFGDHEDNVTLEGIEQFDSLVRKQQAIVAFSSDWGNESFPARQLEIIANYGAVPLVYWSPWDRPSEGWDSKPGRFELNTILAGRWDAYIDMWASRAREYGKPMFVSWGLEMNGRWFPWSGVHYGQGQPAAGCASCFAGPETFKRAYRHVVDRVRANQATNVLWVWHANNSSDPDEPWNAMSQYYPGSEYVDWLGMTAYGTQFAASEDWFTFDQAVVNRYPTLARIDESKPIMLAEWGIGEFPTKGSKAVWIQELFERLPKELPRVRAIVFWHERWQNDDGSISNLRVNSSLESLEAYRKGIANPFWLGRPIFQ